MSDQSAQTKKKEGAAGGIVVLIILFLLARSGKHETVEHASENFVATARQMGPSDLLAAYTITGGVSSGQIEWGYYDSVAAGMTPESRQAYNRYRAAVLRRQNARSRTGSDNGG